MSGEIVIDVFGIRNQTVGCNCNGRSCSSKTMDEMYHEFYTFLIKTIDNVKNKYFEKPLQIEEYEKILFCKGFILLYAIASAFAFDG